jgi:transposase
MKERRILSTAEKEALVRRVAGGERLAAVAKSSGVLRKSLYEWQAAYGAFGVSGLNRKRGPKPGGRASGGPAASASGPPDARPPDPGPPDDLAQAQARIAELERLVGRQQADLDFFRKALRSWDEKRRVSDAPICSPSSKK